MGAFFMQFRTHLMRILIGLLLTLNCFAHVPECKIANLKTKQANITCQSGSSKTTITSNSHINALESYYLSFNKTLFHTPKTIIIKDKKNLKNILQIIVITSRELSIKSLEPNKTWIFEGLTALKGLFITIDGTVIIKGEIAIDNNLIIEAKKLYLTRPFAIKEGSFRLKYQEGFIPRLGMPFSNAVENNFFSHKITGAGSHSQQTAHATCSDSKF